MLTGAGAWLTFGQDKVSRGEMTEYVEKWSPWVRDRGEFALRNEANATRIAELAGLVEKILEAQGGILVEQRVLLTKVEQLLER